MKIVEGWRSLEYSRSMKVGEALQIIGPLTRNVKEMSKLRQQEKVKIIDGVSSDLRLEKLKIVLGVVRLKKR